jgi:aspartyl-tRNA(Asn)/glutamyl-tRNA(Gln) amidotransferase subunit A
MTGHDLSRLTLVEAADAVKNGDITAVALTETALDRLETFHPKFNNVSNLDRESALESAAKLDSERKQGKLRGTLHGVPLAHKDLFFRSGKVTTVGSPICRDYVAEETATVIDRLEGAGSVTTATLHMTEFAFSPTGYNKSFGHGRNPWDPERICGGSSSGSAISVAARLVYGSLGTDTGGSIRHPAAMCGVTGLKTTQTRVSRAGVAPLSFSLDSVGPIARTARDCARLLTVIAGADAADPTAADVAVPDYEAKLTGDLRGVRIAVPRSYYYDHVTDDVRVRLDDSIAALRDLGAEIVETGVPDMNLINTLAQTVMAVEAATVHQHWLRDRRDDYAEVVRSRIEPGLVIPATRYVEALSLRARLVREYIEVVFGGADLVHLPAVSIPVPTIAETTTDDPQNIGARLNAITHCTRGINYLGLPSASVPAGFTRNGMPCAFQLVGRPFAEAEILRAADAYQGVTEWHRQMPELAN